MALFVLILVVPVIELAVIVHVAEAIGVLPTLAFLVLVSLAGAWLVKQAGLGALRRIQDQLDRGELPAEGVVDGLVLLVAGALLLFPGFVTDALGLLLLLPPVRVLARMALIRRFRARMEGSIGAFASTSGFGTGFGGARGFGTVSDFGSGGVTYTYGRVYDVRDVDGSVDGSAEGGGAGNDRDRDVDTGSRPPRELGSG